MNKKVVVLGGGISGLSAAWKLSESGFRVNVLESKDYLGGLAATLTKDGKKMDFGPHSFFSEDEGILNTIISLFDGDVLLGSRNVKLYMNEKYLRYPLKAEDILMKLGVWPSVKCFLSMVKEKLSKEPIYGINGPNMEQWSIRHFGKELYELFFKPYTEQFWDVPCNKLSPDCIPTYKKISFFKTIKLLLTPTRQRDNLSIIDRETLPYYYPKKGFGSIGDEIAKRIFLAKGNIHLSMRASEVRKLPGEGFVIKAMDMDNNNLEIEADFVVSTIPIPEFTSMISPDIPDKVRNVIKRLKYLSLIVLYIVTERDDILDCMYEYCLKKPYNRIADVNNTTLVPTDARNGNMLSIEKSCHFGDKWWHMEKDELFRAFMPYLEEEGILDRSEVLDKHVVKASHAYPMYLYDYRKSLDLFNKYIESIPGIKMCGRTGTFKYMDIDQCMKMAFTVADEIIEGSVEKRE